MRTRAWKWSNSTEGSDALFQPTAMGMPFRNQHYSNLVSNL